VLADDALCVIEWPSRGSGWLPPADVHVTLEVDGDGRRATLESQTQRGAGWLAVLGDEMWEKAQERP
jgi:tRNA threonylcarbamoyladenosine biosynthesis protein TsaE